MTKRKPTIYVADEVADYFLNFRSKGSNIERNGRLWRITETLLSEGFPKSREEFIVRIALGFGVSRRTAKEYIRDAREHTFNLMARIAQKLA